MGERTCDFCDGAGTVDTVQEDGMKVPMTCENCHGKGKV